jgi:Mor family transcriptional regulator
MEFHPHYPEILAELAEMIYVRLAAHGVTEAENLARSLAEDIRYHWGGGLIYIPKGERHRRNCRDAEICRQFNGHNHAELARRHGLGIAAVYAILGRHRRGRQYDLAFAGDKDDFRGR